MLVLQSCKWEGRYWECLSYKMLRMKLCFVSWLRSTPPLPKSQCLGSSFFFTQCSNEPEFIGPEKSVPLWEVPRNVSDVSRGRFIIRNWKVDNSQSWTGDGDRSDCNVNFLKGFWYNIKYAESSLFTYRMLVLIDKYLNYVP